MTDNKAAPPSSGRRAIEELAANDLDVADLLRIVRMAAEENPWRDAFDFVGLKPPPLLPRRAQHVTYRVRLDVDHARPPIWRRLDLPSDLTLDVLHTVIQVALGWQDFYRHEFVMGPVGGRRMADCHYAPFLTADDLDGAAEDGIVEADIRLDEVLGSAGDRLFYMHDSADSWGHTLRLEEILPAGEPGCVAGGRAGPPEDCGDIGAYNEIAEYLAGKGNSEEVESIYGSREELLEWLPVRFDPAEFDRVAVDDAVRKILGRR